MYRVCARIKIKFPVSAFSQNIEDKFVFSLLEPPYCWMYLNWLYIIQWPFSMHDFFDCICMMMIVILTMLLVMIIQYNNNGSVIRTLILSHQTCYCKYNVQQMWTELKSNQRNMSHSSACMSPNQNIYWTHITLILILCTNV